MDSINAATLKKAEGSVVNYEASTGLRQVCWRFLTEDIMNAINIIL